MTGNYKMHAVKLMKLKQARFNRECCIYRWEFIFDYPEKSLYCAADRFLASSLK